MARVYILREDGLACDSLPQGLSPAWFADSLRDGHQVQFVDSKTLASCEPQNIDLLILPYGQAVPVEFLRIVGKLIDWGVNVMTTAGLGLGKPMVRTADGWQAAQMNAFEEILAPLGLKYYDLPVSATHCRTHRDLLGDFPLSWPAADNGPALTVNTSDGKPYSRPPAGNVFPERIPLRAAIELIQGTDRFGQVLKNSVLLVKDWDRHGRLCLVTMTGQDHVFNTKSANAAPLLRRLVDLTLEPLTMYRLEPSLPCYRQGETVTITGRVKNRCDRDIQANVDVDIVADDKVVATLRTQLSLTGGQVANFEVSWPGPMDKDLYKVRARLSCDGKVVDVEEAGFVCWNENAQEGKELLRGGHYFNDEQGNCCLIHGANYYESHIGELMWLRPNVAKIDADLRQMAQAGVNMLRPHYHHSKWFRDYSRRRLSKRMLDFSDYFSVCSTEAQPQERDLRVFDAFVQLCRRNGIVFHPDIFTLIPQEMGWPLGWVHCAEPTKEIMEPQRRVEQNRFIATMARRYAKCKGLFWDLWNEPDMKAPGMKEWIQEKIRTFRDNGDNHPITVGSNTERLDLETTLDAHCRHGDMPHAVRTPLPFFMHESWNHKGCSLEQEDAQRRQMIYNMHAAFGSGACGFQPWSWTRQARLWNNGWGGERWDDELGVGTHDDATLKPAGRAMADINRLMDQIGVCDRTHEDIVVVYPQKHWDPLTDLLETMRALGHAPMVIGYEDLAPAHLAGVKLLMLIDPPTLSNAVQEAVDKLLADGGTVYRSEAEIRPQQAARQQTENAIDAATAMTIDQWQIANFGKIDETNLRDGLKLESLQDAALLQWVTVRCGENWGTKLPPFSGAFEPGPFRVLKAQVQLQAPASILNMDNPMGYMFHRCDMGDLGLGAANIWAFVDDKLVAKGFGWGQELVGRCDLSAGKHEVVLVFCDVRNGGGILGKVTIGQSTGRICLQATACGKGKLVQALVPEFRSRSLLAPLYTQLLKDANLEGTGVDSPDTEAYKLSVQRGQAYLMARPLGSKPAKARLGQWEFGVDHGAMLHLDGQSLLLAEVAGSLTCAGKAVLGCDGQGTVMAYSRDCADIRQSAEVWVKLNQGPGRITLQNDRGPLRAEFMDPQGRAIEEKPLDQRGNEVSIACDAQECNYWIRLRPGSGPSTVE